jgi:hypothetical protein
MILVAAMIICLGGCDERTDVHQVAIRRDSGNVSIFRLHGEEHARLWSMDSATRSAAAAASELVLYRVTGGVRLHDGRVVVGNRGTNEIFLLDSLGRRLRAIGRAGSGPGEFLRLSSVLRMGGDTIAALDGQLRRITVVTAGGGHVRDYLIKAPTRASPIGLAGALGPLENAQLLIWLQAMPSPADIARLNELHKVGQVPLILFAIDSEGETSSIIGEFRGEEMYMGARAGTQQPANWGPAPFGRWTRFGAHKDRVYVFSNAEGESRVYTPEGRLLAVYRGAWPMREVKSADRRKHIAEWAKRWPSETREANTRVFQQRAYPLTMPAYRDAVVGSDGVMWIEPYESWDGEKRLYIGYDSTGLALGKLALRYEDTILEIGNGRVILLRVDADGVENVVIERFRL